MQIVTPHAWCLLTYIFPVEQVLASEEQPRKLSEACWAWPCGGSPIQCDHRGYTCLSDLPRDYRPALWDIDALRCRHRTCAGKALRAKYSAAKTECTR